MRIVIPSLLVLVVGCAGLDKAKIQTVQDSPSRPVKPAVVYVEPFDLGTTVVTPNHGLLTHHPSLLGGGASADPETHAAQLGDLLTRTVVQQLGKDGLSAQRFTPGGRCPTRAGSSRARCSRWTKAIACGGP